MTVPTSEAFRRTMARFATGVTVMTTTVDGEPHGMTANAVSSVSLEPLLVLVCVERGTAMCDLLDVSGVFALSILAADQVELSTRFADPKRGSGAGQFEGVATSVAETGAPLLDGVVGWIDCRVWATYDGGDHHIVVGEVQAIGVGEGDRDALVYFRSTYTTTAPATDEPA